MKLPLTIVNRKSPIVNVGGFTMIEIALCLAIIGFALISILLVLPSGMNTQRDTREETIIGQDASMLMEAIKSGSRGDDDLTNYVYAITNNYGFYNALGKLVSPIHTDGYTYNQTSINGGPDAPSMHITNGLRIIGLLSTPEFTQGNNSGATFPGGVPITSTINTLYTSNHIVAYVRSFSGLAADKPPQNNQIMQEDTFSYRLLVVNAPMAVDTNAYSNLGYLRDLAGNMRELRLLFSWPQEPNGNVGGFRQTFRSTIAGQLIVTNYDTNPLHLFPGIDPLYFYDSQSFTTNVP